MSGICISFLNQILDKHIRWDGSFNDPWEKGKSGGFKLKPGISFPSEKGIYMFKSLDDDSIYYIGKAKIGISARLTKKLSSDLKEKRVKCNWLSGEELEHGYPYLSIYQSDKSRIYFLNTKRNEIDESRLEGALIEAYRLHMGKLPEGNRKGDPNFRIDNDKCKLLLNRLYEILLK